MPVTEKSRFYGDTCIATTGDHDVSTKYNGAVYPNLEQDFGKEPLDVQDTEHYQKEYVQSFVEKWDELIDWEARAKSEGQFFVDLLKAREKVKILDVATGTGFHSVQLLKAGFDVTSVDGNAEMLTKAFENARNKGLMLQTIHSDWRWLNKDVHSKFDASGCYGHDFKDRARLLSTWE